MRVDDNAAFGFMTATVDLSIKGGSLVADAPWLVSKAALMQAGLRFTKGVWQTKPNWVTLRRLRAIFGDKLVVDADVQEWATNDAKKWAIPSAPFRDLATEVDPILPTLLHHQNVGGHWLHNVHCGLLCDQPRVGKVGSVIGAHVLNGRGPLLWIGPKGTLIDIRRQFEKHLPGIKIAIAEGTLAQRRKVLAAENEVTLISYGSLQTHSRLAPYGSIKLKRCPECGGQEGDEFCVKPEKCHVHTKEANRYWQTVVVDECHAIASPDALRTRAIWAVGQDAENRYGLSGTPLANNLADLWSLLHFIAPTEWTGRTSFIDSYVKTFAPPWGGIEILGIRPDVESEFRSLTDPRILRRIYQEVHGEMFEPEPQTRYVELPAAEMKRYNELKNNWITDDAFVMSPLDLAIRLHQMATVSMAQEDGEWYLTGKCWKFETLRDIADDLGEEPFVVFAHHKPIANMIAEMLRGKGYSTGLVTGDVNGQDRQDVIDSFNSGKTRVFVGTYGTASEGVDLSVADTIVRIQRPWSMIQDTQASARTMSPIKGGIMPLLIDIVTEGTIDEGVIKTLATKEENLEEVCRDRGKLMSLLMGTL